MADTVAVNNYLVPAIGTTSAIPIRLTLTPGTPVEIKFRSLDLDGVSFVPTGVYSSTDVTIRIQEMRDYSFDVLAGFGRNYPAPLDQTLFVEGSGDTTLVFVNYPIIN